MQATDIMRKPNIKEQYTLLKALFYLSPQYNVFAVLQKDTAYNLLAWVMCHIGFVMHPTEKYLCGQQPLKRIVGGFDK